LPDLLSHYNRARPGHCGGVDPLRSGKGNRVRVRRAGYGGTPATPGVFAPIGESEKKNKRERECKIKKLSRMVRFWTDWHLIREPLRMSWL
jgi:hypothetical protein